MFDRLIQSQRAKAEGAIRAYYRDRYLPEVIIVPSARFGLYGLAKELLRPGDRVAVSPITCHSVIAALLAAEATPVFVDIQLETGNIDVSRLSPILKSVRAVVTTNLYGNPDRVVEIKRIAMEHGVWVIEDCAHVLRSRIEGHRAGAVGDASVFSFKKYFGEKGGVVTTRDRGLADRIRDRVARQSHLPGTGEDTLRLIQQKLHATMPDSARWATVTYRWAVGTPPRPAEGETPPSAFLGSRSAELPTAASLLRTAESLAREDSMIAERARRIQGIAESCPLQLKASHDADEVCYFVAPFFCSWRDEIIQNLNVRGLPTYFLYPPLNRIFPELARCSTLNLDLIEEWSRNILPVNLDFVDEVVHAARLFAEAK